MSRQAVVGAGQLMSDVVSALAHERLSLPRRRIIGAVMLLFQCSFDEAERGLEAAVVERLEKGYSCSWHDDTSLVVWSQQAAMWVQVHRERARRGRLIEMFPGGAQ